MIKKCPPGYRVVLVWKVHDPVGVGNGVILGQVGVVVQDEEISVVHGLDDLDELVGRVLGEEDLLEAVLHQAVV